MFRLAALPLLLAVALAQAEGGPAQAASAAGGAGGPHSPECARALKALANEEDATMAQAPASAPGTQRAAPPQLLQLRRAAARACLGADEPAPPAGARVQAPVSVGSPIPSVSSVPRPVPAQAPPAVAPQPRPPRLLMINSCDAAGCWASDGTRLPRVGLDLLGPRGFCTQQGSVVTCP